MGINIKHMKKTMCLIIFTIFVWWIFDNIQLVGQGINLFFGIMSPFIIGIVIAFIFNEPMKFIEKELLVKLNVFEKLKDNHKRYISFLITLILFILIITIVLILVIPNIIEAGQRLTEVVPEYWDSIKDYIENSSIKDFEINNLIQEIDLEETKDNVEDFIRGGLSNWVGYTFSIFSSAIGGIVSLGLGIVFAIYFLLQKEDLIFSIKKFIYSMFPLNIADEIIHIGRVTRESFSQFLTGQTIDTLVLGGMFLVTMLIFKFPYAVMISIIIAITGFIPLVGAFIGLVIGLFLIFTESPKMAGFFIILFFILQQIESNIVYPKVVGKASGLSSVWLLAAVTLGGSLMGVVGIIIFAPLFSVIQKLLQKHMDKKLKEKNINISEV